MSSNILRLWTCGFYLLLLVVGIHDADIPLQSTHVTKYVEKCPDEGYFFKTDYQNGSPSVCYLCFCKDSGSAVCWPRNNRRCDAESYQHNWAKKRVSRSRRSPMSFGNFFIANAARDALNSNGKTQCKPHEASYSEGCPPDDWCVGCTVCDCNNDGKWDCHLLSFCSDDHKKKNKNNKKQEEIVRPFYDQYTTPKSRRRANRKLAQEAVQRLAEKMAQDRQKKKIGKNNQRRYFFRNGTLVNKTIFDLRKRKKSPTIVDQGTEVLEKWNQVNMKIRKIPDDVQKQMMLDKQNQNAKKVSESANFLVRNMPNQKTRRKMEKSHAEAVSILASREPLRKKKRQIILPSGVKLPKEILDKLPDGVIPPSRDPPGKQFPKASHVKRVLTNQMAATKPPRKELSENGLSETIPLPSDESKKVLVKRSTQDNVKLNKNVDPPKSNKDLRSNKPATKGNKIIKKSFTGLKERTKQESVRNTNKKISDKHNIKINKNSHPKSDYDKKNTKTYKNNKIRYMNDRSKRANVIKELTKKQNSKKRSLKNNYPKSNNTISQKNKIIKRKQASKSGPKKTKRNNNKPTIMVKKNNNTSKKNISKKEKNIKSNKTLSKLSKLSKSKNTKQTKESLRNKRSNKEIWSKTVKEGHIVKKIAPKKESNTSKVKRSMKSNKPQIDKKKLNERMKKVTGEIQANLNRRVLEAVGRMMGQNLTNKSKKVKRSAPINKEIVRENVSTDFNSERGVGLPIIDSNVPNLGYDTSKAKNVKQNLNLSLLEFSEQRKNKSALLNEQELDNDTSLIDIYIPTAYHRDSVKADTKMNLSTTVEKPISVMQKITVKNSKHNVQKRRTKSEPIKKSQKIRVKKSDKTKVYRQRQGANENPAIIRSSEDVENGMSSNALQDISHVTTQDKFETQDSVFKYYKYALDDDNLAKPTDKNNLNEIIEVYTKNAAAKRSVDNQIQSSPGFEVLQIKPSYSNNKARSVQDENSNNSKIILSDENKNETENDLKVQAAKINIHKPANVLDDRVVIIEDYNAFSTEHLDQFITPMPMLNTNKNLNSDLVNITVIGVKKQESISTEEPFIKPEKTIEGQNEPIIDKTVVIINEQSSSTSKIPTNDLHLNITADVNRASHNNLTGIFKTSLLKIAPEKIKTSENQGNLSNISKSFSGILSNLNSNISEKSLAKLVSKYVNKKKIGENVVTVRENEYRPQQTLNNLHYELSANNVLELATENYRKSQYKVEKNTTKPLIASSENEIKEIETTTTTTPKMIIGQIKKIFVSTAKPDTKDYLTYELDAKSFNLTKDYATLRKLRKYKKAKNIQKHFNVTESLKSKYNINNSFVKVAPKDLEVKALKNFPIRSNATILMLDPETKINKSLNTTILNSSKISSSTLMDEIQKFTTMIFNNVYTSETPLPTEVVFVSNNKNDTEMTSHKNTLKSYEIKKINLKKIKKHKLKKILTTLYNRKNKDERQLVKNNFENKTHVNKLKDMKSFFKKLVNGFQFNKHSRKPSNNKKYQILKYLQKFFKQIFINDGINKNNETIMSKTNRNNIIETLCKTFGPCTTNIQNKSKLQSQLDHLNSETYKMLRSVKIIKGLLKLLDTTNNYKNSSTKSMFKSDIQKLHEILRDKYTNGERWGNLTDTQKLQIQYIKNNTQNFIKAAAKFTVVLNEIINFITAPDSKKVTDRVEMSKKVEKENRKILRSRSMNKTEALPGSHNTLLQLKELISRYSLIQNTFMRKMYNILTDLGSKESAQNKNINTSPLPVPNRIIQNNTEEIQVYTKNIIENLRKLKNLAQHLNGNVRRKRELRDEDSFEYLLMLMEYLLKQKKPENSAPVNDGIDLLLEAIKSAPDIKSIQKKVLPMYNNSIMLKDQPHYRVKPLKIKTKTNRSKESSESDSVSDAKQSKEDKETSSNSDEPKNNVITNIFSNSDEPKNNVITNIYDDDADEEDEYTFNRRAQQSMTAQVHTDVEKKLTTKVFNSVTESHYKNTSEINDNTKPKSYEASSNEDNIFNRFIEYEVTSTNIGQEFEYTSAGTTETANSLKTDTTTITNTPKIYMSHYKKLDDDISASKSRLDWLDETYEEEIKAESQKYSSTTEKSVKRAGSDNGTTLKDTGYMSEQAKNSTNGSRFSIMEKDIINKSKTKDIMHKKDMELLNSLDYGSGKVQADVSASRESGAIDKYSGDAFTAFMS